MSLNAADGRSVLVISPGGGHAARLLPVVSELTARRVPVRVMTRAAMREPVEAAGAIFDDVFVRYPVEAVDRESIPLPARLVTFAAAYADALTDDVRGLDPMLVIYDSFMVAAPLVARRLGIPYVSMRAGHAQEPSCAIAAVRTDPRVSISPACLGAVDHLRTEHHVTDASPFLYLAGVSPFLNLYPEPAAFLDPGIARAFEPLAFFGSLAPDLRVARTTGRPLAGNRGRPRVYVSFGTAIWRYYADAALAALSVLSEALSRLDLDVLVSLGGHELERTARERVERPAVRVETYVDQWGALQDADLFVTHHGLNSTHEAIYHEVPMLSYPFFGDQPEMAATCQRLGVAASLADSVRAPLDVDAVCRQVDAVWSNRRAMAARLAEARTWELDTIRSRGGIVDRMLALAGEQVAR